MKEIKLSAICLLLFYFFILSACTFSRRDAASNDGNPSQIIEQDQLGIGTKAGVPIGGEIAQSMDESDLKQFNHALDKAPGSTTIWTNKTSDIEYTVAVISKLKVHGNALCRAYHLTSKVPDEEQDTMSGRACIAQDGAWSEVE